MSRITVIGGGAWGTTLTILLTEKGHNMTFWLFEEDLVAEIKEFHENRRFLPGFQIPESVEITSDPAAVKDSEILFFVVPTQFSRKAARRFVPFVSPSAIIVSAAKGIEETTLKLPVDILKEELKHENLCALSGPNLASEVAKGLPAATVVASKNEDNARTVQESLMLDRFRVYTNTDIIGVQLGGALKNIIAIASGIGYGLNLGDNSKSTMMVRGIAEIARLGIAMGARLETFAGLSGIGDLITTCSSRLSRNHQVGERIAKGEKLPAILSSMGKVAEGVPTTIAARELGKRMNVSLPITEEIYNVLYQGKDPYWAVNDLMTRSPKTELV